MMLLTDIGGTFVRFGVGGENGVENVRKYRVAEFGSFEAALERYCAEVGLSQKSPLRIATAGYEDQDVWKFVNANPWHIDPQALARQGWDVPVILNDFEAATWGILGLGQGDVVSLNDNTVGASETSCLLGPGTGLGLGYLVKSQQPFVQKTHGGHMPVSCATAEQWDIVQSLSKPLVVFEDLVSGMGLFRLYRFFCGQTGAGVSAQSPETLLDFADTVEFREALRLFHAFLGLFAANAVVTGHAYGGVYLTGGVLDRLMTAGLFDAAAFERSFMLDGAQSVRRDLGRTPVSYVSKPYLALHGLREAQYEAKYA